MVRTAKTATGKPAKKRPATKKSSAKAKSSAKTLPTNAGVRAFIDAIPDATRRADALRALAIMNAVTGMKPKMWGPSIIGYGQYSYKYKSGREGVMCRTGFSPRANTLVFYLIGGTGPGDPLFGKLGKHTLGKSCLYVKRLSDIDESVLRALIAKSLDYMERTYPG